MTIQDKLILLCLAAAMPTLIVGSAVAQQAVRPPAPRPPAAASERAAPVAQGPSQLEVPQRTTATYGDWILQCEARTGPPPGQTCDMAQVTLVQGKNLPFSRVAIVQPEKGQPVKLSVQVPVNASFGRAVRIQTADDDPGTQAPFASCTPNGCFAEFDLKEDILRKLRAATKVGKLSFADAGGHDVSVPISFNGFSARRSKHSSRNRSFEISTRHARGLR